jgi:hypothetical protein
MLGVDNRTFLASEHRVRTYVDLLAALAIDSDDWPTAPWRKWHTDERLGKHHPSDSALLDRGPDGSRTPQRANYALDTGCLATYTKLSLSDIGADKKREERERKRIEHERLYETNRTTMNLIGWKFHLPTPVV